MTTLAEYEESERETVSILREQERPRARRITVGELIALRLILQSVNNALQNAIAADDETKTCMGCRDARTAQHIALNIALSQLNIAQEITKE